MGKYVLKVLKGSLKGQTFPIKQGLKIGRSLGDIILKDSMVSDLHAEIQIYSTGKIMLIDKDSKNKIIMNNKRTVKSILEKGSRFKIGHTEFEVAFMKSPKELVLDFISKNMKSFEDQPLSLKAFPSPIEVVFLSGVQKGEKYYLSYGPRFFGSHSIDCHLFEETAPDKAFALIPKAQSAIFVTHYPSAVRFNGKNVEKVKIKTGDRISIGKTILEIRCK